MTTYCRSSDGEGGCQSAGQDVSQEMEPAVVAHTDVEDILLEVADLPVQHTPEGTLLPDHECNASGGIRGCVLDIPLSQTRLLIRLS